MKDQVIYSILGFTERVEWIWGNTELTLLLLMNQ